MNKKIIFQLSILFVAAAAIISLRIFSTNNYATTFDSRFYLKIADNLYNGNGLTDPNDQHFMTTWPPLYPASIALLKPIAGGNSLLASKIVNVLCLLGCFILLYRMFRKWSVLAILVFMSDSNWENFTHTWSEGLFLLLLLFLLKLTINLANQPRLQDLWLSIPVLLLLILTRYAGFAFLGAYIIVSWIVVLRSKSKTLTLHQLITTCITGCSVVTLIFFNYKYSGYWFGLPRERVAANLQEIAASVANELNLLSNLNQHWLFYIVGLLIMIGSILLLLLHKNADTRISWSNINLITGSFVLAYIILLLVVSPNLFGNTRILSIVTTLISLGVFQWIISNQQKFDLKKQYTLLCILWTGTFLLNLPKQFIIDSIFGS